MNDINVDNIYQSEYNIESLGMLNKLYLISFRLSSYTTQPKFINIEIITD